MAACRGRLQFGAAVQAPADPMGKLFFNIPATSAEFGADPIRMRTREGMAAACAKGELLGERPTLSDRHWKELCWMYDIGEYSVSGPGQVSGISRPTVYRTLQRRAVS